MAVWTVYLSLCLLVALSASVEARAVGVKRCGACWTGWTAFGGRCFKVFSNAQMWVEAEKMCLDFDGNLASVHSLEEYIFIQKLVRDETEAETRAWIGGHDTVSEGVWLWSDGSKMDYRLWSPGNPSNGDEKEHCLEMNYDNGNWNDDQCYKEKPFVCVN